MAEPTQYKFPLREVAVALVKEQGLHDGRWTIGVEFGLGAALAGPQPQEAFPTAFAHILAFQLTQAGPNDPAGLVVNAAEVNPRPTEKVGSKRKLAPSKER